MSAAAPQPLTTQIFPHKSEVCIVFGKPIQQLFLPPQNARDIAEGLIKAAELAEQQMDDA